MDEERPRLPRVKVCGMTRPTDVFTAVEAGADALGFVSYWASPRDLPVASAAELVGVVPEGIATVAVMVDPTPDHARRYVEGTGTGWLQLCGDERPVDWFDFPRPILRRVAVDPDGHEAAAEIERWRPLVAGFVLDHPSGPGGTGLPVDLAPASHLAALAPCLLAGGLDAENVAGRVALVRPAGVDGSSRLESEPGKKDSDRVLAFVAAAREALAEVER